ncbi:hypothetical protein EDB19DRAFT_1833223 [Suillus lakei]|nr:hypothetical protein EDB19DRAFT_1833223 [Suillus lakei]
MPSPTLESLIKGFFKHLDLPKGFAVRSKHPAKTGGAQRSSTATHDSDEDDHFIPTDIPMHPSSLARDPGLKVSTNSSSARSFGRVSLAHDASDMAQTLLPFVLAIAGPIPLAGAPVKAAIDTSAKLTELRKRCLTGTYPSVTQDIARCFTKIDHYMAEYLVVFYSLKILLCRMQNQDDICAMLAMLQIQHERQQEIPMRTKSRIIGFCGGVSDEGRENSGSDWYSAKHSHVRSHIGTVAAPSTFTLRRL